MPLLTKIQENIKKYLKKDKFTLIKEKNAYSHDVYKVETDDKAYIYKEYKQKSITEAKLFKALNKNFIVDNNRFRIEEYLESTKPNYLADAQIIVESLKEFHNLKVKIRNFFSLLKNLIEKNKFKKKEKEIINLILKKIKEKHSKLTNEIKVCHNDLQPGNILIHKNKAVLIDFEYASLNHSMFDFANIFCEMSCDYENDCTLKKELFPSEEVKKEILKWYDSENIEVNLRMTNELISSSHFLWFLWARCYIGKKNNNNFNYFNFAECRLSLLKEEGILEEEEFDILLKEIKNK